MQPELRGYKHRNPLEYLSQHKKSKALILTGATVSLDAYLLPPSRLISFYCLSHKISVSATKRWPQAITS